MIQFLSILLLFFWLIRTVINASLQAYLWQLKEYRFDRLLVHLRTLRGRKLLFNPLAALKWLLLIVSPFLFLTNFYRVFFPYAVILIYTYEILEANFQVFRRQFKRPVFTYKVIILLFMGVSIELSGVLIYLIWTGDVGVFPFSFWMDETSLLWLTLILLLLDRMFFIITLGCVLGLQIVTWFIKRRIILAAKRKIKSLPHLSVIGVTGSYGKSGTKIILHTILSSKFKCFNTPGSINTDIGVAQVILRDLKPEHEIFVVEMGAYRLGEITAICDMVNPKIGIITAINEQHLALFKTLETTLQAKFELIDALPTDGLAIFNADNKYLKPYAARVQIRKFNYSIKHNKADVYAENITVDKDRIYFRAISHKESQNFQVQMLGRHNVSNILAAVCAAQEMGMSLSEIAQAALAIEPAGRTMKPYPGINGSLLIDDTYSSNPDGVLAALEYLQTVPANRRIMITPGILELGPASKDAHRRIGRKIAQVCDLLIITNQDYAQHLLEGLRAEGPMPEEDFVMIEKNVQAITSKLKYYLKDNDVVLFQGRGPEFVLKQLRVNK